MSRPARTAPLYYIGDQVQQLADAITVAAARTNYTPAEQDLMIQALLPDRYAADPDAARKAFQAVGEHLMFAGNPRMVDLFDAGVRAHHPDWSVRELHDPRLWRGQAAVLALDLAHCEVTGTSMASDAW